MDSNSNNRNPIGRPSKFKAEYCQLLIDHMTEGYSFESFAATIDVAESTIYEWANNFPEFSEAKQIAFSKSRLTMERVGFAGEMAPAVWIFSMKNRFPKEWRERKEIIEESKQNITHGVSEELTETTKELIEVLKEWKKS